MKHCIYCRKDKDKDEFTLEHVIPQFLGGAHAPNHLKTRDVCKNCNNNLGLFVDAGFEKNWIVSNRLRECAAAFFDPEQPTGLPLICMGDSDLTPPNMPENHVCELWLGPLGEQIFWIRPQDDRLYWYVGGNPRETKKIESRAYFLFSERSQKNPMISWLAFKNAFEGRRVKKIMCTIVEGANPEDIGFSSPDDLDLQRINYFNNQCSAGAVRKNRFSIYKNFDLRFLAKTAIGISYCLFGSKILDTPYGMELHKALWYKDGNEDPKIFGKSFLSEQEDPAFNSLIGQPHAVTILILPLPEGIFLNLNIGTHLNWKVMISSRETLNHEELSRINNGFIVVLYRSLQKGFQFDLPFYISHKLGNHTIPELLEISKMAEKNSGYFSSL